MNHISKVHSSGHDVTPDNSICIASECNEELHRIRRTMRDMVALSTLPAVWGGLAMDGIAASLAKVLLQTLHLDLIYVRIAAPGGSQLFDIARSKHQAEVDTSAVRLAFAPILSGTASVMTVAHPGTQEQLQATITRFGLVEDRGVVVTACSRADFPTEQDRLLLGFAANQVAVLSQRRRAEQALRKSEQRFFDFADSAPAMLWVTEADGSRSFLSHGWCEFTGQTQSQGLTAAWIDTIHPDDRAAACRQFALTNERKKGMATEYRLRRADGQYRWVLDTCNERIAPTGEFLGFVGNILDISDRKQSEVEQLRLLRTVEIERQRLADVFQQSPSFMCVLAGPEHVFERINDQFLRLIDHRDVLGATVRAALPEVIEQGFVALLDEVYRTGVTYVGKDVSIRLQSRDKRHTDEHILDFVYQAMRGVDGTITGIFVQGIDLTERKRAEAARRHEADQRSLLLSVAKAILEAPATNAALFELVFDMIKAPLNADLAFTYELRADKRLGLVVASGIQDEGLLHAERLGFAPAFCGMVAATRAPLSADEQRIAGDPLGAFEQRLGVRALSCHPLLSRDGSVLGTFSVASQTRSAFSSSQIEFLQTVSHFLSLAWDRHKAEEELRKQERRKDEFLATLAHELRNPLAPIRTGLDLLNRATSIEATVKTRQIMERQLRHMVRLIDDLLEVSRITTGKIQLRKEKIDVHVALNAALEIGRPLIDEGRHQLFTSISHEPLFIDADPTRIAQVIGNLLINSAKYTPQGGRIELTAQKEGADVVIRVHDNGTGLTAESLRDVFELFSQVGSTLDRAQAGLGIGLALVKRLVEMHGGSVSGDSAGLGQGATFSVRLPLLAASQDGAGSLTNVDKPGAETMAHRVLVVDDNKDAAETLCMLLGLTGHVVHSAHNGPDALAACDAFCPDIVFLDIGLPGMSGYEVARHLRANAQHCKVTLVALTGWGTEDDRNEARSAGFDHHLTKPFDLEKMEALLMRASPPDKSSSERPDVGDRGQTRFFC